MLRLAALNSASPRLAARQQHESGSLKLSKPMLEKLSAACQRYATVTNHSPVNNASSHTIPAPIVITPLPKSPRIIVPFMHTHARAMSQSAAPSTPLDESHRSLIIAASSDSDVPKKTARKLAPSILVTNAGIASYLSEVYRTTAISLTGTLACAYACSHFALPLAFLGPVWFGSFVAVRASARALRSMRPTLHRSYGLVQGSNSWQRHLAFTALIASSGIALAPVAWIATTAHTWMVPVAAAVVGTTLATASTFAASRSKAGARLRWQAPIVGACASAIGLAVGACAWHLAGLGGGVDSASALLSAPASYGALACLALFATADGAAATREYRAATPDHLRHAADFHTHATNLVTSIVRRLIGWPGPPRMRRTLVAA